MDKTLLIFIYLSFIYSSFALKYEISNKVCKSEKNFLSITIGSEMTGYNKTPEIMTIIEGELWYWPKNNSNELNYWMSTPIKEFHSNGFYTSFSKFFYTENAECKTGLQKAFFVIQVIINFLF